MPTTLYNYCENAIKILKSQFEICRAVTHNTSAGSVREQLIRDFLANHLPTISRIVSGHIFDSRDSRSTQQDVIIILNTVPRLPFASGIDLVYVEGVIGTIEIKTNLSAVNLKQAGSGISSVRALQSAVMATAMMSVTHNWPSSRILNGIVTYEGSSFSSLIQTALTMPENEKPDYILDLSKGILIRNNNLLLPNNQNYSEYIEISDSAKGFMYFMTFLTEITGTLSARGTNWRAYI